VLLRAISGSPERRRATPSFVSLRGLLFSFLPSVTSDAKERVPTGGELTLFEAVGRARA
jgi:hypothetical protein